MQAVTFQPLIPPALWVTLAVALGILLTWYGWRAPARLPRWRWLGALGLTGLGGALALVILLNPNWTTTSPPPAGKPQLTVLVDRSASMSTPDTDEGATRWDAAARLADELRKQLAQRFDVRTLCFDARVTAADVTTQTTPDGASTDLAEALRTALQTESAAGQAVVVLSDGIHNASATDRVLETMQLARAVATPLYTQAFGGAQDARDVALELGAAQELAAPGQKVTIRAQVRQHGLAGRVTTLVLRDGTQELERRSIQLADAPPRDTLFEVQEAKLGLQRYELEVEPLPEEVTRANNTASFVLRVVDRPVNVMLLEGKPYWDGKFLMRTFASDPLVELHSLVRLSSTRVMERRLHRQPTSAPAAGTPTTNPTSNVADARREEWRVLTDAPTPFDGPTGLKAAQILVLGREAESFLNDDAVAQIRDWVARDGGALVCYRGAPVAQVNQPLAHLLPVRWVPGRETRFLPQFTPRGDDLRWLPMGTDERMTLPSGLPTLAMGAQVQAPAPLAVVLATAEGADADADTPVITYQTYGAGRIVVVEGAGMWRWALQAPRTEPEEEIYATFWHSLLHWLVSSTRLLPGQNLALHADQSTFSTNENATVTLLLRAEALTAELPKIELIGNAPAEPRVAEPVPLGDEPGTYRVSFGALPEGHYRAQVTGAAQTDTVQQVSFDVRGFLEEKLDLRARPDLLRRIAEDSGGAVLGTDAPEEINAHFREYLARSRPATVHHTTAWDRWWFFTAICAAWAGAWTLRRSGGLV